MHQTRMLIIAISTIVLMIGLGWSLMGAYLIMPFAGLEVGLFAYFMTKVCKSTYEKQVIVIDEEHVLIQSGKEAIEHSEKLDRPSAYVLVVEPELPSEPIELKLNDSKSGCEVGSFLNDNDKIEARQAFKKAGLIELKEKWWIPTS